MEGFIMVARCVQGAHGVVDRYVEGAQRAHGG